MTHSSVLPDLIHDSDAPGVGSMDVPRPSEIDRLDPPPEILELESGTKVRVLPLKMRQLFRLMRIVTRGGAAYLPMLRDALVSSNDENAAEIFGTQLLAIAMIALPEAEDEAVDFVHSVVEPHNLGTRKDKQTRELNDALRAALAEELYNPELGDIVTILEAVISREKDDLVALGKRLGAMFTVAQKTGQMEALPVKTQPESSAPTQTLSAPLPEPVTWSPQSTDGPTQSSSTSPSAG